MPRDDAAAGAAPTGADVDPAVDAAAAAPPGDVFTGFAPPFDLSSDLLFAATSVPTPDLAAAHAAVPFLSVAGHTPLLLWSAA